jgi:formate hydrogenlyase subunit 3/multisubunit Na+/H+ antiporter MnhD subunit
VPNLSQERAFYNWSGESVPAKSGVNRMTDFGKLLIVLGLILVVAGVLLTALGRTHFPLGRLPGDIVYRGKRTTVYFPLVTCILLSVVLTIVLYVLGRWRR